MTNAPGTSVSTLQISDEKGRGGKTSFAVIPSCNATEAGKAVMAPSDHCLRGADGLTRRAQENQM